MENDFHLLPRQILDTVPGGAFRLMSATGGLQPGPTAKVSKERGDQYMNISRDGAEIAVHTESDHGK
jgi:hypothetical protein